VPSARLADPEVIVAGAGPTGLLLAGQLQRRGVACLVIDALDAPRTWDRATVVHPRSMEIFEALGVGDRFLRDGVRIRAACFRSGGRTLGRLDLSGIDTRYPFDVGISEEVTESVLLEDLERHGGGVLRATRLTGLEQTPGAVEATIEQDGARRSVRASWLVACDGFHSTVRSLAGIGFRGTDIEPAWAVFDAAVDGWDEELDLTFAHLDVPPVILTPLPGGRFRVYLRPASDASDLVADATKVIARYKPGVTFTGIENPARFHCHSRVAARFRQGRVLLAGDAAHACSPAEGHGMNTGLQDAFNLGWKLALVCQGVSEAGLLDSYEEERRPVALKIVESGSGAEAAQGLTLAADRMARDDEIERTYADPDISHHEAVAAAEVDGSYAGSSAVAGTGAGERLPDLRAAQMPGAEPGALHELTYRDEHTLLVLGGPRARSADVGRLAGARRPGPVFGAVLGLTVEPDGPSVGRIDAVIAERLGIDDVTVLAVRPDRVVGFRHDGRDPAALRPYLEALRVDPAAARRSDG
jgi:2-polyprenyl-6-methoxyphenol hydroxylase-like FAD-dependent oxidoreductase